MIAQGERGNSIAHRVGARLGEHEIPVGTGGRHLIETALQVLGLADVDRQHRDAQRRSGGFQLFHQLGAAWKVGLRQDADIADLGRGFLQHLQRFCGELHLHERKPGHVAARPRQTGDKAISDRVVRDYNDRDRRGGLAGCPGGNPAERDNEIDLRRNKSSGIRRRRCRVAIGEADLDRDVAAIDPAERVHARAKGINRLPVLLGRERGEHADTRHARKPLRHNGAARHSCGEKHRDQRCNPPYTMTSSAPPRFIR